MLRRPTWHARAGCARNRVRDRAFAARHDHCDRVVSQRQPLLESFDTDTQEELLERREPGRYRARLDLPLAICKEGNYTVELHIRADKQWQSDPLLAALSFEICNYREDPTRRSYRAENLGDYALDIPWNTTRV